MQKRFFGESKLIDVVLFFDTLNIVEIYIAIYDNKKNRLSNICNKLLKLLPYF